MKEFEYILTWGEETETLGYNPAGFDKLGVTLIRHELYASVLRSYTMSLRFMNISRNGLTGGYQLVSRAYESEGIHAVIGVEIRQRNPLTDGYDEIYTGVLDLTPGRWKKDRNLFWEIPVNDSSVLQKMISRDENEVDITATKTIEGIAIPELSMAKLLMTPVNITTKAECSCVMDENEGVEPGTYFAYLKNPTYTINESENLSVDNQASIYNNGTGSSISLLLNVKGSYSLQGDISGLLIRFRLKCVVYDAGSSIISSDIIYEHQFIGEYDYSSSYDFSKNVTLEPGYYVEIFLEIYNLSSISTYNVNDSVTVSCVEVISGKPTTEVDAALSHEALDRALMIITDRASSTLHSDVMGREDIGYISDGELALFAVTNGRKIRGYPSSGISLTLRGLFSSLNAAWNLGLWYDDSTEKFTVEKKSFFFQNVKVIEIKAVSKFTVQAMSSSYYSKIIAGYDTSGSYDRVSGANEFAVKKEYSTSSKVKEEKNIRSPYRFDPVGMEQLRNLGYSEKGSTDSDSDNDIFIVDSVRDGLKYTPRIPSETDFPLDAKGHDIFSSYYNLYLTPRQNMIRWGNMLMANCFRSLNPIVSQKTEKLFDLEFGAGKVDENSDIQQSELESPLFIPEEYSGEGYITIADVLALKNNPHGYLELSYEGVRYEGFIDKFMMVDNQKVEFKLIAKNLSAKSYIFENGNNFLFENGNQRILE